MTVAKEDVRALAENARTASRKLSIAPTRQKDDALRSMARHLRSAAPAILAANAEDVSAARSSGKNAAFVDRLLLDAQGIVRLGRPGPLAEDGNVEPAVFRGVTILTMNEPEAHALVGGADPERVRALGVPEVVITLASRGALVVGRDTVTEVAAHAVDGAVDPTGAGDSFALLYLDARSRGAEPADAADSAARIVAELIAQP